MAAFLRRLYSDERGQDMVEYALLLAFVVLTSAALLLNGSVHIEYIWHSANNSLSMANSTIGPI